jgi:hypothetical protein
MATMRAWACQRTDVELQSSKNLSTKEESKSCSRYLLTCLRQERRFKICREKSVWLDEIFIYLVTDKDLEVFANLYGHNTKSLMK